MSTCAFNNLLPSWYPFNQSSSCIHTRRPSHASGLAHLCTGCCASIQPLVIRDAGAASLSSGIAIRKAGCRARSRNEDRYWWYTAGGVENRRVWRQTAPTQTPIRKIPKYPALPVHLTSTLHSLIGACRINRLIKSHLKHRPAWYG